MVHIKKETNEWYPQSHVTSLHSLILTVEFPLGSGCTAAEAIAIFNTYFNYNYSSMISSVVRTFFSSRKLMLQKQYYGLAGYPMGWLPITSISAAPGKARPRYAIHQASTILLCEACLGISRLDGCLLTSQGAHLPSTHHRTSLFTFFLHAEVARRNKK